VVHYNPTTWAPEGESPIEGTDDDTLADDFDQDS